MNLTAELTEKHDEMVDLGRQGSDRIEAALVRDLRADLVLLAFDTAVEEKNVDARAEVGEERVGGEGDPGSFAANDAGFARVGVGRGTCTVTGARRRLASFKRRNAQDLHVVNDELLEEQVPEDSSASDAVGCRE